MVEQRQLGGAPLPTHSLHSVQWLDLLSSQIKFDMLTMEHSKRLFQLLAAHCPLHDSIMRYVIQIAFKMLTGMALVFFHLTTRYSYVDGDLVRRNSIKHL